MTPKEAKMATRNIAIACQGGGSHAAYTAGVLPVLLGEFDNLARAHASAHAGGSPAYREAGLDPGVEAPVLAAISGTSGGAISALLGWYGFITGGADEARRRLDAFWDGNSATHTVEATLNHYGRALSDTAALFGLDVKSSPYLFPLRGMEYFNTMVWPRIASGLGPDNPWMRPDYFMLPKLLYPSVDWQLIHAYGIFASIPLEVQRWVRSDLEAAMFAPDAPCQQRYRAERAHIEGRIEERLGAAQRVLARMDALGLDETALLRAAFGRWQAPAALRFEPAPLEELARDVQAVTRWIPRLLIGAVELHEGDFVAFSSERAPDDGGLSMDAVLASASVPWLFRARAVDGTDPDTLAPRRMMLWDGLFSQNPPLRDFLSGVLDDAKKPDEIWVVQINPSQAKVEAVKAGAGKRARMQGELVMDGGEIWDLRNALAGNLALNQEIGFVEAINRRMETAPVPQAAGQDGEADEMAPAAPARGRDRLVQVDRIIMDGDAIEAATGMDLGANSKLDRDPRLKDALCEHGRLQARRYLTLRRQVGQLCGELGQTLAGACGSVAGIEGATDGACRAVNGRGRLVVDGSTLYSTGMAGTDAPRALVRWRTVDAQVGGRPARIEGRSELADDMDSGSVWHVKAVRITGVVPKGGAGGAPAGAGQALGAGVPAQQQKGDGGRRPQ
jgi:predicted acylesterase/phospholipase RssA